MDPTTDATPAEGHEIPPRLAFVAALLYVVGADGAVEAEEVGHLLSVVGGAETEGRIRVGGDPALLARAVALVRATPVERFLDAATPGLSPEQRLCILLNMVDAAMAGGVGTAELPIVSRFQRAFGIPDARFRPHLETILLKNDRALFA